jgi:hypothetical protein
MNWNQATDTITRAGNATALSRPSFDSLYPWSMIRRCNLSDAGVVTAYYGDAAFKYDGSNGQVMVEVPKFYYKFDHTATTHTPSVSRKPLAGYTIHPAFITDSRELDKFYVGAFEACAYDVSGAAYNTTDAAGVDFTATTGDKLASIAGVKPMSGKNNAGATLPAFRIIAKNRGTGWGLQTFQQVSALELLYAIEYANWNSQSVLSVGVTNITDDSTTNMGVLTGATAGIGPAGSLDLGNANGEVTISHYQTSQATKPMSYRGVENFYGNLYKWVDGLNIKGNNMPWVADHDLASDVFAHPYVDTGLTLPAANGYVSNLAYAAGFDWAFLPSAAAGSSTTYLCDYYYQNTGNRSALFGGSWYGGAYAGAFAWNLGLAASSVNRLLGARVAFTPQI